METPSMKPMELFYSYAHTKQDEALRIQLNKHLTMLEQIGLISGWHVQEVSAGKEREQEIERHFNNAHIILLLISPDFIASPYCYGIEMKQAIERHNTGKARVIPILLRPVDYKGASFEKLQVLPFNGKAITRWTNRDEAFKNIVVGIRNSIEEKEVSSWR